MARQWRGPSDGPPPALVGGRPLKRWRYLGAYGAEVMLCVGVAEVGPLRQAFWAVWLPRERTLYERTVLRGRSCVAFSDHGVAVSDRELSISLRCSSAGAPVEVVSPHGTAHIWTRKTPVEVRGLVLGRPVELFGLVDESAGHHARHTAWTWSAGVGVLQDGRRAAWNLVEGVHDGPGPTERAVCEEGVPEEAGPVAFAADLSRVGALKFSEQARRARRDEFVVFASDYVQPFGTFAGELPGGLPLAEGFGVMERHSARW